jgi:hypothetical protein
MMKMLFNLVALACILVFWQAAAGAAGDAYYANTATANSTLPELLEYGFTQTDITSHDGLLLKSIYFDNKPESGEKNPTVIFISSWGMNKWEYVMPAKSLAENGYTVVSYTGTLTI